MGCIAVLQLFCSVLPLWWTLLSTLFCIRFLFLVLRQLATRNVSSRRHTPYDDERRFDFFFSGTCDVPLIWNSSKRQIERHLLYHFFHKAKNNHFLADRLLEPVGWLMDKIAIKGKKIETSVISVFLNQNAINNPSDLSFFLTFGLIYILIVDA